MLAILFFTICSASTKFANANEVPNVALSTTSKHCALQSIREKPAVSKRLQINNEEHLIPLNFSEVDFKKQNQGHYNALTTADNGGAASFPKSEYYALQSLYESTGGDQWVWKDEDYGIPWNFSNPYANPCSDNWQGIECTAMCNSSRGCHVNKLELDDYGLHGYIPSDICNLTDLIDLYITYNPGLSGPIPVSLGQISSLNIIQLVENNLTGTLPVQLSQLSILEELALYGNNLTGHIPIEYGQLYRLRILHLDYNYITGMLPHQLSDMTYLEEFSVGYNLMSGQIPNQYGQFAAMRNIYFEFNTFTGTIPMEFFTNMTKLKIFSVTGNALSGVVPDTVGSSAKLVYLELQKK